MGNMRFRRALRGKKETKPEVTYNGIPASEVKHAINILGKALENNFGPAGDAIMTIELHFNQPVPVKLTGDNRFVRAEIKELFLDENQTPAQVPPRAVRNRRNADVPDVLSTRSIVDGLSDNERIAREIVSQIRELKERAERQMQNGVEPGTIIATLDTLYEQTIDMPRGAIRANLRSTIRRAQAWMESKLIEYGFRDEEAVVAEPVPLDQIVFTIGGERITFTGQAAHLARALKVNRDAYITAIEDGRRADASMILQAFHTARAECVNSPNPKSQYLETLWAGYFEEMLTARLRRD